MAPMEDAVVKAKSKQAAAADKLRLEPATVVMMNGAERFVAADHFQEDISPGAVVQIAKVGDGFQAAFGGRVEINMTLAVLSVTRLSRKATDQEILDVLGARAEVALVYIWGLLTRQPHGESGTLSLNHPNGFYIRDAKGALWSVYIGWYGDGWCLHAYEAGPVTWDADADQIFSY